jgi:hypothetical protein
MELAFDLDLSLDAFEFRELLGHVSRRRETTSGD